MNTGRGETVSTIVHHFVLGVDFLHAKREMEGAKPKRKSNKEVTYENKLGNFTRKDAE